MLFIAFQSRSQHFDTVGIVLKSPIAKKFVSRRGALAAAAFFTTHRCLLVPESKCFEGACQRPFSWISTPVIHVLNLNPFVVG